MTTEMTYRGTPEELVRNQEKVPTWARNAACMERDGYGYECYELMADGMTLGWMYDDGAGYLFSQDEPDAAAEG